LKKFDDTQTPRQPITYTVSSAGSNLAAELKREQFSIFALE